jgi:phosphohistidine phosphatase
MLRLLILRHAKAVPAGSGLDFDRALTAEGRSEARKMGALIERRRLTPGFAAISSARRAMETWQEVRLNLSTPPAEALEPKLYEASAGTLIAIVRKFDARYRTALMVGHNPGLEALTTFLTGRELPEKFTTCALAIVDFNVESWDELSSGKGVLSFFVTRAGLPGK